MQAQGASRSRSCQVTVAGHSPGLMPRRELLVPAHSSPSSSSHLHIIFPSFRLTLEDASQGGP